jgi:hypothetical protein
LGSAKLGFAIPHPSIRPYSTLHFLKSSAE